MTTPKTIAIYEDEGNESAYNVGEKFEIVSKKFNEELGKVEIVLKKMED